MPVEIPWLICCRIEPEIPAGLRAKIPSVQNPRWLTDEYATSFFQSFCMSEASAPYTMPTIERNETIKITFGFLAASGSSGIEKRRNPYVPIFSRTLARSEEHTSE